MNLLDAFRTLGPPQSENTAAFSAERIVGWGRYRVACDVLGRPALLIDPLTDGQCARPNAELRYVSLWPSAECEVASEGRTASGVFAIIRCKSDDRGLQVLFLDVLGNWVEMLGQEPTIDMLSGAFERLAQLFEALSRPAGREVQGLWGEVLVIAASSDPTLLVKAWHTHPSELYDFQAGLELVEVKTTATRPRRHEISLAQLTPPSGSNAVLASVLVEETGPTVTLIELIEIVKRRLSEPRLRVRVDEIVAETLGANWVEARVVGFNAQRALAGLRFVPVEQVPCVNRALPPEVSDVRFKVELDGAPTLEYRELRSRAGLLGALVPRNDVL